MKFVLILLQRARSYRYDDHGGGGSPGEVLFFWVFVGVCYLIYLKVKDWGDKVDSESAEEDDYHYDDEFVTDMMIKFEKEAKMESYGSTYSERRQAIEDEAFGYIRDFRRKTGFERNVAYCYLSEFLFRYEMTESPRPGTFYGRNFMKANCPEVLEWFRDNMSVDSNDFLNSTRSDEYTRAMEEAKKRFAREHVLGDRDGFVGPF